MGQIIYNYFTKAGDIGGIKARTKLSILTKISSIQANSISDTAENIKVFEDAIKTIIKEFQDDAIYKDKVTAVTKTSESNKESADVLRKHIAIFSDVLSQRSLFLGDLNSTYKRITETLVQAINVERASIWFYDEANTGITCADLFIRTSSQHSSGAFLVYNDFPNYFKSIETERTLAAHDAHKDTRTREFSESYLTPLGINSLLDVPIWVNGKMIGVLCHEHVGPTRTWTSDEENFAYLMGHIVALAIENNKK